jgi:hypothetical protein
MARVALITTGQMEHRALGNALHGLFPNDEFVSLPNEAALNSFTSNDVAPLIDLTKRPVPTALEELAAELVNAVSLRGNPRSHDSQYPAITGNSSHDHPLHE